MKGNHEIEKVVIEIGGQKIQSTKPDKKTIIILLLMLGSQLLVLIVKVLAIKLCNMPPLVSIALLSVVNPPFKKPFREITTGSS